MSKLVLTDLPTVFAMYRTADQKGKAMLEDIFGEDVFNPQNSARVKTYEGACAFKGIAPLTLDQFEFLPDDQQEYYFLHHQIVTIVEALNKGRIPNYDDPNEKRYELWWDMRSKAAGGSGLSYGVYDYDSVYSFVGARLVFFDPETAKYAASQFLSEYKVIMTKSA